MNLKRKVSRSVSLALTSIIVASPIFNVVSAMDSNNVESQILQNNNMTGAELTEAEEKRSEFNEETPISEVYSIEQEKLYKVEFQQAHGIEDKFEVYIEIDGVKAEANGAKGIIRITTTDVNSEEYGEVIEINVFEGLEDARIELNKKSEDISTLVNRPTSWRTQGPDKANLSVRKGSTRDSIKAYNPSIFNTSGKYKSYTKSTNSWYTGYTKGYYDSVQKARRSFGTAKSSFAKGHEYAVTSVAIQFLKKEVFNINSNKFLVALKGMYVGASALEYANAARYGAAYLANMGEVRYNYTKL